MLSIISHNIVMVKSIEIFQEFQQQIADGQ